MAHRIKRRGRGFTLVELLVVISIIGMLVGLLLPAINNARENGRRTVCMNNMRNVALALLNYETGRKQFPGYLNVLMMNNGKPYMDQQTGQRKGVSFIIPILANLDRPDLDRAWKTPAGAQQGSSTNSQSASSSGGSSQGFIDPKVYLDLLICPSDPPTSNNGTPTSYVANTGMQDSQGSQSMPRDWADNGVFFDRYTGDPRVTGASGGSSSGGSSGGTTNGGFQMVTMSNDYIMRGDGVTNTLLLSENVDAGDYTDTNEAKLGMVWNGNGTVNVNQSPPNLNPPDDNMRINRGTGMSDLQGGQVMNTNNNPNNQNSSSNSQSNPQMMAYARPSSFHPGGVNTMFCDGRGRFVSDSIDYYVYCLLMSSNGQRVRKPGTNQVLPNFNRPINDSWIF